MNMHHSCLFASLLPDWACIFHFCSKSVGNFFIRSLTKRKFHISSPLTYYIYCSVHFILSSHSKASHKCWISILPVHWYMICALRTAFYRLEFFESMCDIQDLNETNTLTPIMLEILERIRAFSECMHALCSLNSICFSPFALMHPHFSLRFYLLHIILVLSLSFAWDANNICKRSGNTDWASKWMHRTCKTYSHKWI